MADYLRLHKIVTGMNARSVWELLESGKGIGGFEHTPEHFRKWLAQWSEKLNREFNEMYSNSPESLSNRPNFSIWAKKPRTYRARFAEHLRSGMPREFTACCSQCWTAKTRPRSSGN